MVSIERYVGEYSSSRELLQRGNKSRGMSMRSVRVASSWVFILIMGMSSSACEEADRSSIGAREPSPATSSPAMTLNLVPFEGPSFGDAPKPTLDDARSALVVGDDRLPMRLFSLPDAATSAKVSQLRWSARLPDDKLLVSLLFTSSAEELDTSRSVFVIDRARKKAKALCVDGFLEPVADLGSLLACAAGDGGYVYHDLAPAGDALRALTIDGAPATSRAWQVIGAYQGMPTFYRRSESPSQRRVGPARLYHASGPGSGQPRSLDWPPEILSMSHDAIRGDLIVTARLANDPNTKKPHKLEQITSCEQLSCEIPPWGYEVVTYDLGSGEFETRSSTYPGLYTVVSAHTSNPRYDLYPLHPLVRWFDSTYHLHKSKLSSGSEGIVLPMFSSAGIVSPDPEALFLVPETMTIAVAPPRAVRVAR